MERYQLFFLCLILHPFFGDTLQQHCPTHPQSRPTSDTLSDPPPCNRPANSAIAHPTPQRTSRKGEKKVAQGILKKPWCSDKNYFASHIWITWIWYVQFTRSTSCRVCTFRPRSWLSSKPSKITAMKRFRKMKLTRIVYLETTREASTKTLEKGALLANKTSQFHAICVDLLLAVRIG